MLAQAQMPLRLNVEQILAAILLLSDEEKTILQKSTPVFVDLQEHNGSSQSQPAQLDIGQAETTRKGSMNKGEEVDSWSALLANIEEIAVDTGIEDLSINHDHYLYGLPKRSLT